MIANKQAFQIERVDEIDDFFIGTVENSSDDDWTENIMINNKSIEVKLDTGAQCNVMSRNVYNSIVKNDIVQIDTARNIIAQKKNFPIVASNAKTRKVGASDLCWATRWNTTFLSGSDPRWSDL